MNKETQPLTDAQVLMICYMLQNNHRLTEAMHQQYKEHKQQIELRLLEILSRVRSGR